jgi:hypothetical protein
LEAALRGKTENEDAGEFAAFRSSLEQFVRDELLEARIASVSAELSRLGRELHEAIELEEVAAELGIAELRKRIDLFRSAAAEERRSHSEDDAVLHSQVKELKESLARQFTLFGETAPFEYLILLEEVGARTPKGQLEDSLGETVEACVQEAFDDFRDRMIVEAQHQWHETALQIRERTQARTNRIRTSASDLFNVELQPDEIPAVLEEDERFFYYFLQIDGLTSGLSRIARRLLPTRTFRRQALAAARRRLLEIFDMHAGRARWDLCQRIDKAADRFGALMRAEIDRAEESILRALANAETSLELRVVKQGDSQLRRNGLKRLIAEVRAVSNDSP